LNNNSDVKFVHQKVWDREKVVVIPDHYIFTNDERAHRNVDIARDFCVEQDIKYFYDIQDRSNFRVRFHIIYISRFSTSLVLYFAESSKYTDVGTLRILVIYFKRSK